MIILVMFCVILVTFNCSWGQISDTWTRKASMHTERSQLGMATLDGKIYAIGGCTAEGFIPNSFGNHYKNLNWISKVNEEYDPETNSWLTKTSMPTARYNFEVAACQSKIYCIGGVTDWYVGYYTNYTTKNEVYDPITGEWETKASSPQEEIGQANVVNNKIYLVGGGTEGTLTQVYDPSTDTWTSKAPLPEKIRFQVSAVANSKIFVFGYMTLSDNEVYSKGFVYDPIADEWSNCTGIPMEAFKDKNGFFSGYWYSTRASATTGEKGPLRVYVFFSGYMNSGPIPVMEYNPMNNSWSNVSEQTVNRQNFAVATLNDKVYVVGGEALAYPFPGDSYFTVEVLKDNMEYTPFGYGTPEIKPTAINEPTLTRSLTETATQHNPFNIIVVQV